MDDIREKLLSELHERIKFDNRHAWRHLRLAVFWTWVAIVGSLGASLLAALDIMPPWAMAILAAIPGIVIVITQRFSFFRRSRWHCMVETHLRRLVRALEYEDATPSEVSKQFSDLMLDSEPQYPGHGLDGFVDITERSHAAGLTPRSTRTRGKPRAG